MKYRKKNVNALISNNLCGEENTNARPVNTPCDEKCLPDADNLSFFMPNL